MQCSKLRPSNGTMSNRWSDCPQFALRETHGGTGAGLTHSPFFPSCIFLQLF